MTNPSKAKGNRAEREVCDWLAAGTNYPVHRRIAGAQRDCGDIGGVPSVCVEVKSGQPAIRKWLREIDAETLNAGTRYGFVVWRTPGVTDGNRWVVLARPHRIYLRPRFPIVCTASRLPYMVNRVALWCGNGLAYTDATIGARYDGFMPESVNDCHYVAMTGAAWLTWLRNNTRAVDDEPRPALVIDGREYDDGGGW